MNNIDTQTIFDAAKQYRDAGISIIPARYVKGDVGACKMPASDALKAVGSVGADGRATWNPYKLTDDVPGRIARDDELRTWFAGNKRRNLAIVLGEVSGGLIALDFDEIEAYKTWAKEHAAIAKRTAIQKTGQGYHVLLRVTGRVPKNASTEWGDVKAEGGCIVAWPSEHGSGRRYEWLEGHAPWESGVHQIESLAEVGIASDDPDPDPPPPAEDKLNPFKMIGQYQDFVNDNFPGHLAKRLIGLAADTLIVEGENRPLQTISIDQVMTTDWPEPVWAIPNLLPAGLTIFAGRPKIGKSWLVLQLAHAVATGGVFLGQRLDAAGPVLYLALEDTPRRLQSRIKMQGWSWQGLPIEFVTIDEFKGNVGSFLEGGALTLGRMMEAKQYHLVIVDTLSRACFDDQNRNERMSAILAPLHETANGLNVPLALVDHHSSHLVKAGMDAIGDILGGTSKGATLDTAWGLYREKGKQDANLAITGRDVDEQNLSLTFNKDNGVWHYNGDYYDLKMTERRQEFLTAVEVLGSDATNKNIARNLGCAAPYSHKELTNLVNSGHLKRDLSRGDILYVLTDKGKGII